MSDNGFAGLSSVGVLSELDAGWWAGLAGGATVLLAMAVGGGLILALLRGQGRLVLRMEALEARLKQLEDVPVIGREAAPALRLPDLTGAFFELSDFRGSETVLLFWDPASEPCRQILEELQEWERAHPIGPRKLVVVSTGSVEANREMGLTSLMLLEESGEVAGAFGATSTPSAVLLDKDTRLASGVVLGGDAVVQLLTSA
jgi:hypothetical protein